MSHTFSPQMSLIIITCKSKSVWYKISSSKQTQTSNQWWCWILFTIDTHLKTYGTFRFMGIFNQLLHLLPAILEIFQTRQKVDFRLYHRHPPKKHMEHIKQVYSLFLRIVIADSPNRTSRASSHSSGQTGDI